MSLTVTQVDFKSKVSCFVPKSSGVVLVASRRLKVDPKSL